MGRELDLRSGPPPGVRLELGQEWWVDHPHRLAARVREDRRVVELTRWELAPGLHGSVVRRLRPRPAPWVRPTLVGSGVTLVGLALLALVVELVTSLVAALVMVWPVLLALGTVWAWLRVATGHQATCAGLHCPGCRG